MQKVCVSCKNCKIFIEFGKNKTKPDGLQNICKSCKKDYQKKYYKQYNKLNREKRNKKFNYKMKTDPNFRLAHNLRVRLRIALKRQNTTKQTKTLKLLGCSLVDFKIYIESKFQNGMSWSNYGQWHIDHIRPLSKFNLKDNRQLEIACNYKNLQPLWAKDNLSKNNR